MKVQKYIYVFRFFLLFMYNLQLFTPCSLSNSYYGLWYIYFQIYFLCHTFNLTFHCRSVAYSANNTGLSLNIHMGAHTHTSHYIALLLHSWIVNSIFPSPRGIYHLLAKSAPIQIVPTLMFPDHITQWQAVLDQN